MRRAAATALRELVEILPATAEVRNGLTLALGSGDALVRAAVLDVLRALGLGSRAAFRGARRPHPGRRRPGQGRRPARAGLAGPDGRRARARRRVPGRPRQGAERPGRRGRAYARHALS
ncbi:hypothetical protein [Actinomadura sp. B10D3]|uniref:hypothetical protein n=1 Tax=Actinomadura sp. B10D3 TaxID=3153557 RepID=UPI00325F4254